MTKNFDANVSSATWGIGTYALLAPHIIPIPAVGGAIFGAVVWLNTVVIDSILHSDSVKSSIKTMSKEGKIVAHIATAILTVVSIYLSGVYTLTALGYAVTMEEVAHLFIAGFLLQSLILRMPIDRSKRPEWYPEWLLPTSLSGFYVAKA